MICLLLLLNTVTAKAAIHLPEEIIQVADLVGFDSHIFILDARERALWKLDSSGSIIAQFGQKGSGPGEWQRPFRLRVYNGKVFVPDLEKRVVLVLNTGLDFVKEFKIHGMVRDIALAGPDLFLAYYDPASDGMIHLVDDQFQQQRFFGKALEKSDLMMGFQSASMILSGDRLFYMHQFLPLLQVFNLEGMLIQEANLPGMQKLFIKKENLLRQKRYFRYVAADLFFAGGKPCIKLEDHLERKAYLYQYDLKSNRFPFMAPCPWRLKSDQDGGLYKIARQGECLVLEPIDFLDLKRNKPHPN